MTLLRATALSGGYGAGWVVREVDLAVDAGEVVCVLGPNGAGKTTLLRALSGALPSIGGEVAIDGVTMRGGPHRRVAHGLVHVPEGRRNVIASMTVRENLRLVAGEAARDVVELFPVLGDRLEQQAGTLSGGQQQMLAIALGLALRPRVLLVDEPSAGLAPSVTEEVLGRIGTLGGQGIAVVLAEQRLDLALAVAQRGYVLEAGRLAAAGTVSELRSSGDVRTSYLGADARPSG